MYRSTLTLSLTSLTALMIPAATAMAGIVTVSGPGVPGTFTEISDAMAWISAQGGSNNYTVSASAGRYNPFEIVQNASLSWGNSPGVIDVGGNLRIRSNGGLCFELGGTSNANAPTTGVVDYDTVLVDGGSVLYEGQLSLKFVNGFSPTLGDTFELISATGSVTWDAATAVLDAPSLAPGLSWQVSVGPSTFGTPAGYGTFTNSLFVSVVPTPGALALLGLAGVVARRRR